MLFIEIFASPDLFWLNLIGFTLNVYLYAKHLQLVKEMRDDLNDHD